MIYLSPELIRRREEEEEEEEVGEVRGEGGIGIIEFGKVCSWY